MAQKKKSSTMMALLTPGSRGSPSLNRMKLSSVSQVYQGYLDVGVSSSDSEDDLFYPKPRNDFKNQSKDCF
jgi:hypothetical protein